MAVRQPDDPLTQLLPEALAQFQEWNAQLAARDRELAPKICRKCDARLRGDSNFCGNCGWPLRCPKCRQSLSQPFTARCRNCHTAFACAYCGHVLQPLLEPCRMCGTSTACESCGYLLTGNTTGRCPECGERCKLKISRPYMWPPEPPKHGSFWFWLAIALLVLLAGIALCSLGGTLLSF